MPFKLPTTFRLNTLIPFRKQISLRASNRFNYLNKATRIILNCAIYGVRFV